MKHKKIKLLPSLLAADLILMMSGCGSTPDDSGNEHSSSEANEQKEQLTAAAILDRVAASGKAERMTVRADLGSEDFNSVCEKLYGVKAESLTDGGIIFEESGQYADEVSVLKGADESVLKDRAAQRAQVYEGYAPAEAEKAQKAEVFTYEGFTILVISDNAADIKKDITSM